MTEVTVSIPKPTSRSKFVLVPVQFAQGARIVVRDGSPKLTLTLGEMFSKFVPSGRQSVKEKIARLRSGYFVGLMREQDSNTLRMFYFFNRNRDMRFDWLLREQPTLLDRLVELYEVETALLDAAILSESSDES